jgi:hypothetical protein
VDDDEMVQEAIKRAREAGVTFSDEAIADEVRRMRALHEIGPATWQLEQEEGARRLKVFEILAPHMAKDPNLKFGDIEAMLTPADRARLTEILGDDSLESIAAAIKPGWGVP